jgi:hypothetical protein
MYWTICKTKIISSDEIQQPTLGLALLGRDEYCLSIYLTCPEIGCLQNNPKWI